MGAQRFDNYITDKKDNYKDKYQYKGKENYKDKGTGWYCGPRERDGASGRSKN